jgi:hypothetical protein
MARFEQISFSRRESEPVPERLPVQTCFLAITCISLVLWLALGLALRLSF